MATTAFPETLPFGAGRSFVPPDVGRRIGFFAPRSGNRWGFTANLVRFVHTGYMNAGYTDSIGGSPLPLTIHIQNPTDPRLVAVTRDALNRSCGCRRCRRMQAGTDHFGRPASRMASLRPGCAGRVKISLSNDNINHLTLIPARVIIVLTYVTIEGK